MGLMRPRLERALFEGGDKGECVQEGHNLMYGVTEKKDPLRLLAQPRWLSHNVWLPVRNS